MDDEDTNSKSKFYHRVVNPYIDQNNFETAISIHRLTILSVAWPK